MFAGALFIGSLSAGPSDSPLYQSAKEAVPAPAIDGDPVTIDGLPLTSISFGTAPSIKPSNQLAAHITQTDVVAAVDASPSTATVLAIPSDRFAPSLAPWRRNNNASTPTETLAAVQEAAFNPREKQEATDTEAQNNAPLQPEPTPAQQFSFDDFVLVQNDDDALQSVESYDLAGGQSRSDVAIELSKDIESEPTEIVVKLNKGETFVDAMRRAGVRSADRNAAAAVFGKHKNLRYLQVGQEFSLTVSPPNQTLFQRVSNTRDDANHLLALEYRLDTQHRLNLQRTNKREFDAVKTEIPLTRRLATIKGKIEGSLFLSAQNAGAPSKVIGNFANMFAYDIDFQRDIFGGDEFEAIYEVFYDDKGEFAGSGDILFGRLKWRGQSKEKGYYRFANKGDNADYFDRAGQSAKRLLMKTPIDGARLSSGFGTRRHPILGYRKAHRGVDFAAPRGTPIYAAGDGVIERANRYGSFGNYIRIRHANGYETAYAHLKGFRKGIRKGKKVRQGDVIGYVGTTGRSTGPHLHYEVHRKGKAVNPQKLKIATGVQLKGPRLDAFKSVRNDIDEMRAPPETGTGLLAEEEATNRKSL